MAKQKTKLYKSKAKQGVDECIFELALTGGNMKDLSEQPLINAQGKAYGSVQAYQGKATISLNLPKFIRGNNLNPFGLSESIYLEIIRNDCDVQLKRFFGVNMNTEIKKIEVNITQRVSGNATPSDVLNFLSHATLSHEFDNVKYVGKDKQDMDSCKEECHTIITKHPKYWIGKFYNKTEEMIKKRLELNKPVDDIPLDLLRIEFILIDRTLKKLFGSKTTLADILTKKNLLEVLREYKRIFCDELITGMIIPYLNACNLKLLESLTLMDSPILTVAKHRELIPDVRVLHRALGKYQKLRGKTDNSARDSKRYAEQYDLPVDVIMTIKDFKRSCG
ncbi:hypothetical protein [Hespellia stercorisuis]|uniref:Uncharacterized protein n=1 Tax=Hespellia stercorisuis DSM 15480 TaxID=1121950 RepID=A0A1M6LFN6_9FIRM|nr:hypothetical protein [Hespellia stercorisuis]SHJ70017.1 hypothetical protein SAMN02745243_01179 [Hespellia stercorisuis DSM 15480]